MSRLTFKLTFTIHWFWLYSPEDSIRQIEREAIVKHPEPGAQDSFRAGVLGAPFGRPGHADARREIAPVVDVGLCFVAQPKTQREVRPRAPVVAGERAHIDLAA